MRKVWMFLLAVVIVAGSSRCRACSPSGHVFVSLAAIERLKKSDDPEVRKLAKILEKYRWVVCQGSEGPDFVQRARGYQNSHYKVLFNVSYESPQSFDLGAAQPVFTSLLRDSYAVNYGLDGPDVERLRSGLYLEPSPEKREVSLAFAAGYISHLLADYFCHRPALTWWEKDSAMQEATKRACPKQSYGPIQCVFACFEWRSHAGEYGITKELVERYEREVDDYKQDNGVLPYCALACSRRFYGGWGIDTGKFVDPAKYEPCLIPMLHRGHLSWCIKGDDDVTMKIFAETGRSFEENLRIGTELTPWKKVYDDVIVMIAKAWADAAPSIGIGEVDDTDVIRRELEKPLPRAVSVPARPGSCQSLVVCFPAALTGAVCRDGLRETFKVISEETKAMFKPSWVEIAGERLYGLMCHPPWVKGPGEVYADFLLNLPDTKGRIEFRARITLHANIKDSDGVAFKVAVAESGGSEKVLAEKHWAKKEWAELGADLSPYHGKTVTVRLIADAGPKDSTTRDNGFWGAPMIRVSPAE